MRKSKLITALLVEYDNVDQSILFDPFFFSEYPSQDDINKFFNRI